jgi:predicted DNA-binding transcriptional regulator YafY
MPPLLLDDDEAVAIVVGLRTAAGAAVEGIEETSVRALAKLEQVLPARLRRRVGALQASTMTLQWASPGPVVDPEALTVVAQACRDEERLQFEYRPREGEPATRAVEPHRLVSVGRRWYLVAWDVHRADWRTFRLDRLSAPCTSGARFVPRPLPAQDAAAFVQRSLRSVPTRYEADVTVHLPAEEVEPRVRPFGGTTTPEGEGRCRMRMAGDSLAWLAAGVALLECDFEVHGPPELLAWLDRLGGRIARGTPG